MSSGNVALITGTSRGIGKALASLMLEKGWVVYGIARNKSINHGNYHHLFVDLSVGEKLLQVKFPEIGDADKIILVNNAATLGMVAYFGDYNNLSILEAYTVNIIAPAIFINKFLKKYGANQASKLIINITSGAAQNPYDGWGVYCSSKAALDMLTRVIDTEFRIKGRNDCRILSIAPGVVETNMQEIIRQVDERSFSRKEKFIRLKEESLLATPEQAAQKLYQIIDNPDKAGALISRIEY